MAFGLHKPGQGYWVRVMTAAMAGMLVLACCAWLWAQVGALDLPYGSYRVPVSGVAPGAAAPAPGAAVELIGDLTAGGSGPIGAATVAAYESSGGTSGTLVIRDISIPDIAYDVSMTRSVRTAGGAFVASAARPMGVPLVEPMYVQAGAAAAVLLLGALLTYWLVGVRTSTVEFLIATDGEMKKVNWSTWKDIRGSTLVVISASFLIAAGLFGVDFIFSAFFRLIGVLQQ
jgi:preprotein translocase SecE subunit